MDFAAILAVAAKAPSYSDAPDLNIYFTDDSGLLLIDGDGSLIVEG